MTKEEKRKEYQKLYARSYYESNRERIKSKAREYNRAHKDQIKAYYADWYKENKDRISESNRAYYQAHKDELKAKRIAKQLQLSKL